MPDTPINEIEFVLGYFNSDVNDPDEVLGLVRRAVAEAVAAERERCAAVARDYADDPHVSPALDRDHLDLICEAIARRIREGKP